MKKILILFLSLIMLISISSLAFAAGLDIDMQAGDTVISTQVPATHEIKIETIGNGTVFYNGFIAHNMTVDRMAKPTVLIRGESNYVVDQVMLDDQDITEKIKGGYYTLDQVCKDSVLKVSFKELKRGDFQFTLAGRIYKNDATMENCIIELRSELKTFRTDQDGKFVFSEVEDGHHSLTVIDDTGKIMAYTELIFIRDETVPTVEIKQNSDGFFEIRFNSNYVTINLELNVTVDGKLEIIKGTAYNKEDSLDVPKTVDSTSLLPYFMMTIASFAIVFLRIKRGEISKK